jgi:WXXGXW repeat (2 copies)/Thrombospondin type 3 repeat
MTMFKKILLAAMIAASLESVTVPVLAADVVVHVAPPPLRAERVPPPRRGYVWVPGYWDWRGNRHIWIRGNWVQERPGYMYNRPAWVERDGRWHMQRGEWARGDRNHDGIPDRMQRDRDHDGIPNRMDRDRDGDGVPNRMDAHPDNPRRN